MFMEGHQVLNVVVWKVPSHPSLVNSDRSVKVVDSSKMSCRKCDVCHEMSRKMKFKLL